MLLLFHSLVWVQLLCSELFFFAFCKLSTLLLNTGLVKYCFFPRSFDFDYNSIAMARIERHAHFFLSLRTKLCAIGYYLHFFYPFVHRNLYKYANTLKTVHILILHHFAYTCQKWIYFCDGEPTQMNGLCCLPCFFFVWNLFMEIVHL